MHTWDTGALKAEVMPDPPSIACNTEPTGWQSQAKPISQMTTAKNISQGTQGLTKQNLKCSSFKSKWFGMQGTRRNTLNPEKTRLANVNHKGTQMLEFPETFVAAV